jgi:hypothetical protein
MAPRTVKGSHVLQVKAWIDRHLGTDLFGELTKHAGEHWAVILPVAWYEVDVVNEVMHQASQRSGISVEEISTEVCQLNAERDLTSIYRIFLRVAQPQRVLDQTPKLWRTYVSFAEARAIRNDKGHYVGQGDGYSEELVDWACGCWLGFIPTTIRLAGGKSPRSRIVRKWRGSDGTFSVQLEVLYS